MKFFLTTALVATIFAPMSAAAQSRPTWEEITTVVRTEVRCQMNMDVWRHTDVRWDYNKFGGVVAWRYLTTSNSCSSTTPSTSTVPRVEALPSGDWAWRHRWLPEAKRICTGGIVFTKSADWLKSEIVKGASCIVDTNRS
ncbi:MAG: hypothetical protein RI996_170 [Candidatus Parcubacteria bacterium]|jgi:hypothetical protein